MKIEKICERCGKTYSIIKSRENKSKYCSWECKTHKICKICPTCKCKFEVAECFKDTAIFCSRKCIRRSKEIRKKISIGVSKYFKENGVSNEVRKKISVSLKGKKPWNTGKSYKNPKQSRTMKERGHWKKGQTFEERFGKKKAKILKKKLSDYRKSIAKPKDEKYRDYKLEVWTITNKQPLNILENIEKRGKAKKGTDNYQLDHIIPIRYGYLNNIDPKIVGNIKNLRMIPWKQNIKRYRNETNFFYTPVT